MNRWLRNSFLAWLSGAGIVLAQGAASLPLPPIPPPPSQYPDTPAFVATPATGGIQPVQGLAPLPPVKSPPAAPPLTQPEPPPEFNVGSPPWWNNGPPVSGAPLPGRPTGPYVVDGQRNQPPVTVIESRFWLGADFLVLFGKGYDTPPLVGVIQDSNTSVINNLYPDERLGNGPFSGVRLKGGFSFESDGLTSGFDISYTHIFDRTTTERFGHVNGQVLGRPFVDAASGVANLLQATTSDGFLRGSIVVKDHTEMNGGEVHYFVSDPSPVGVTLQYLVGFRYFRLADRLRTEFQTEIPSMGLGLQMHDEFKTTNRAYMTQLGFRGGYSAERWFVNGELKVGLGVISQRGSVDGSTTAGMIGTGLPAQSGGLFALPGNIGNYDQNKFGFMPELALNLGFRVTPSLSVVAGYEFMFINSVIRPGGLMDGTVNTQRVPSVTLTPVQSLPNRPMSAFNTESFWLQGISIGLQYRF